jgi:hypothetical protein
MVPVPDSLPGPARGHPVVRTLMLIGWTLVFWGTLVAAAMAWRSVELGPAVAFRVALDDAGRDGGWISLSCAGLAVVVWTAVGVLLVRRRLGAPKAEASWP